jgi:cell division protein FtsB
MKPFLRWRSAEGAGRAATRVEVLRYDPDRRRFLRLLFVLSLAFALGFAFWLGQYSSAPEDVGNSLGELEAELRARSDEVRILEQQVANLQAASGIESSAASQLRSTLSETQATVDRLAREGELYRSLMDSSVQTRGLTFQRLEIRRSATPGRFVYRLTLLQRAQKHVPLGGKLALVVKGVQGGKAVAVDVPLQPLKMLYFQILDGEFRLPEGFEPRTVRVVAEVNKGRPQKLESTQDWQIEEN